MNRTIQPAILSIFAAISCFGADQTWTGTIGDSMCGVDHGAMAAKHGGADLDCVNEGGKFVFVSNGRVYAGHAVRLTREMTGDTIKASS